jgi:hypothetical protein
MIEPGPSAGRRVEVRQRGARPGSGEVGEILPRDACRGTRPGLRRGR